MTRHWINTATGRAFDLPLGPLGGEDARGRGIPEQYARAAKAHDYSIADIAVALSHQARYAGHTRRHYSVAEHSIAVADIVHAYTSSPERFGEVVARLETMHGPGLLDGLDCDIGEVQKATVQYALLHDAAEAYCTDVPWPLIAAGLADELVLFERAVSDAIVRTLMDAWPRAGIKRLVKLADLEMLDIESETVLFRRNPRWESPVKASDVARRAVQEGRVAGAWKAQALRFVTACMMFDLATHKDFHEAAEVLLRVS